MNNLGYLVSRAMVLLIQVTSIHSYGVADYVAERTGTCVFPACWWTGPTLGRGHAVEGLTR